MQDKKAARLDKRMTRQDKTRQYKTRQDKTAILGKTITRHGKGEDQKKRLCKHSKSGFDSRLRRTSTDAFSRFGFDSNAPMDSKRHTNVL